MADNIEIDIISAPPADISLDVIAPTPTSVGIEYFYPAGPAGLSGSSIWGTITGTLSTQTDLWNALQTGGGAGDVSVNTLVHTSSANWNTAYSVATAYSSVSGNFVTAAFTNSNYLPLSGGVLTGTLSTSNAISANSISSPVYYGTAGNGIVSIWGDNYNGGIGGCLLLNGSDANDFGNGGNGGIIDLRGSEHGVAEPRGNGGCIVMRGGCSVPGGSLIMNGGYNNGAGNINTSGSDNNGASATAPGGSILTYGGGDSSPGGSIDTSGGADPYRPGGSINTSNGGGPIITNGSGCIGLGSASACTQTMLCGTVSTGYNQILYFPDTCGVNGTIALQGCFPNNGLTSKIFRGGDYCGGIGGYIDVTSYHPVDNIFVGNGGYFVSKGGCGYGIARGGNGGIVDTSGGGANEGSGGGGGNGGAVYLGGGTGTACSDGSPGNYCQINGGNGGCIISNGGYSYNNTANGGTLNMSAGFDVNGGSIDTSNGGGSIVTNGVGYIGLGSASAYTQTMICGTVSSGFNQILNLPDTRGRNGNILAAHTSNTCAFCFCPIVATIFGGCNNSICDPGYDNSFDNSSIVGGSTNCIVGYDSAGYYRNNIIGSGSNNIISGGAFININNSGIGSGSCNTLSVDNFGVINDSYIVAGCKNTIYTNNYNGGTGTDCSKNTSSSIIAGGVCNSINANNSFIGSGSHNFVCGDYSAILGGQHNSDCGFHDVFILGSCINATQNNATFVNAILSPVYCGVQGLTDYCGGLSAAGGLGGCVYISGGNSTTNDGNASVIGGKGGCIFLQGSNASFASPGSNAGVINLSAGNAYSANDGGTYGGTGGHIIGIGGDGVSGGTNRGGSAGQLIFSGGTGSGYYGYDGGNGGVLNMSGGNATNDRCGYNGGSINTSNGGGNIDTTGGGHVCTGLDGLASYFILTDSTGVRWKIGVDTSGNFTNYGTA